MSPVCLVRIVQIEHGTAECSCGMGFDGQIILRAAIYAVS